jgi:hypothetical protein
MPLSVADRLDIQEFFARYCHLIDQSRVDEWLALFAPDAVFEVPGMARLNGHEQIRQIGDMVVSKSQGLWRHQITNLFSEADNGADTARASMYGLVTDWSNGGALSTFMDYTARLRRIDGEWRIVEMIAKPTRITV